MNVYRLHLKTDAVKRSSKRELVEYCLKENVLAIGWSYLYENKSNLIEDFENYKYGFKLEKGKIPSAIKYFDRIEENDLIWIRDLEGNYYLCRAKGKARAYCVQRLDIGCVIDVEKIKISINAPGKIVRSFIPGRIIQRVADRKMYNYSMRLFNEKSKRKVYNSIAEGIDLFSMIHPLDLEELVFAYIQLNYDFYLSKNSISNGDSTIKIEGELYPRSKNNKFDSAVLQVKSGNSFIDVNEYKSYLKEGKLVFLFFENENYSEEIENIICLRKKDIINFVKEYKELLPDTLKDVVSICEL